MCEANAFMAKNGQEERLLESVDMVEISVDEVKLINIFGEQKIIKAKLKRYDNTQGKIVFEQI
ncbi:MAG: CooT family nickel-binding protein [Deltaproteobacteria bacterium]|nr:CooT family nickel-binding protein [Deltaproteobacteria bacterium]